MYVCCGISFSKIQAQPKFDFPGVRIRKSFLWYVFSISQLAQGLILLIEPH